MNPNYCITFREGAPIEVVPDLLFLSALATEGLHGRSGLRLDGAFELRAPERICTISAATQVSRDFARIFTGFLVHHMGEKVFDVSLRFPKEAGNLDSAGKGVAS
jgi:hypothetical protein